MPPREADLEVAGERRGGDVALEVDPELRVRAADRPALGIDDDVGAARVRERDQRVGGEGRLARGRAGAEVVEALPAPAEPRMTTSTTRNANAEAKRPTKPISAVRL